jgi:hypothetical protein
MPSKKPTAKKPAIDQALERVASILPSDLLADIDDVRADLRRKGIRVSYSGLVEVALRELLDRNDVAAAIKKHGARARRR